jgi:hypothetical protein
MKNITLTHRKRKVIQRIYIEFLIPVKDPYWLVRSRAFLLDIPIFGEKAYLQQNIELLLYLSSSVDNSKNIPPTNEARMKAHFDLFEKKYGRADLHDKNGNYSIT